MKKIFVNPGYIYLPDRDTYLYTVVGSGIAVTLFDRCRRFGGLCYFIRPVRQSHLDNRPLFALPSIAGLVSMMEKRGSKLTDLEAEIVGGAENFHAENYQPDVGSDNITAARDILGFKSIPISKESVGGGHGRRLVFDCKTGQIAVKQALQIRGSDWYPPLSLTAAR